jgi:hypothetical protein
MDRMRVFHFIFAVIMLIEDSQYTQRLPVRHRTFSAD